MSLEPDHSRSLGRIARLFDPPAMEKLLATAFEWPACAAPRRVCIEKYWPVEDQQFVLEWSVELGDDRRLSVYGRSLDSNKWRQPRSSISANGADQEQTIACGSDKTTVQIQGGGIRGIRKHCIDEGLFIHSPDLDPCLPGLGAVLNSQAPISADFSADGELQSDRRNLPRLLAYRPGRRATVLVTNGAPNDRSRWMVAKMYRDERGRRSAAISFALNSQLAWFTGNRVRVPTVVNYLPEWSMAVFAWAGGRSLTNCAACPAVAADRAFDALAALHLCWLDGLPTFSIQEECAVICRWQSALGRLHPAMLQWAKPVADLQHRKSPAAAASGKCLIHRDYYGRQILQNRETVTFVDLDTLALGPACLDLGNFMAHAALDALAAGWNIEDWDGLASRWVRRYECRLPGVDRRCLAFYCASSLYRVAAVHAMRSRTGQFSQRLWALAEALLKDMDTGRARSHFSLLKEHASILAGAPVRSKPRLQETCNAPAIA